MAQAGQLKRELGIFGAVMMGLGSIVGTGIFVSVGIGAGIAGPAVLLAIALAALVASCNGISSAQLAANHPVSGGTYEYGYRYLNPRLGFIAGWLFLLAKSASAATAALGFSGYVLDALNAETSVWLVPLALATVILLTMIVLGGLRRSNLANTLIVSLTLLALAAFVAVGLTRIDAANFSPFFAQDETGTLPALLHATALMFVAYTGYGRVATLGEEVRDPRRTVPRAVIATLIVTMLLYMSVAFVGVGVLGAPGLAQATAETSAPLEAAAATYGVPPVHWLVTIGAMTAMLGVLLNLILGLSRVLLAMGRRGDMPPAVARLNTSATTPFVAVIIMGIVIGGLVLIGNVRTTWSFSAFTVLMYYSLTNLSALRLKPDERLFSPLISVAGLIGCLFLAFWVQPEIWLIGLILIAVGLIWQQIAHWIWGKQA
ncbi:MAG: amino acid permease [Anaerolineae bacterium]|nr:amino acid permease [Anaerolineae bacterium]